MQIIIFLITMFSRSNNWLQDDLTIWVWLILIDTDFDNKQSSIIKLLEVIVKFLCEIYHPLYRDIDGNYEDVKLKSNQYFFLFCLI